MSRVGRKTIDLPKGVTAQVTAEAGTQEAGSQGSISKITVKGPKGQLQMPINPAITVEIEGATINCKRTSDLGPDRAAHGLTRALIANMAQGVSTGFERKLEINGVGYRAEVSGKKLVMQLGFSHPVEFALPEGIAAKIDKNVIILSGIDKAALGLAAAKVRSFRPPEPYKGKGVKYLEETILRKEGKAAGK
jgi:large subunit ribosomal protein L6